MPNEQANMPSRARLVYDPAEFAYNFGGEHPLQAGRQVALMDLLESSGLWQSSDEQTQLSFVRTASVEDLGLIHTPDYIAAVQRLSAAENVESRRTLKRCKKSVWVWQRATASVMAIPRCCRGCMMLHRASSGGHWWR